MRTTILINGVPHTACDACEEMVDCHTQERDYPDEGLQVTFSGWYGGFTDTFEPLKMVVCHDCARKMWSMFPALRGLRAQHSRVDGKICCRQAFGRNENGKLVDSDGRFV